jgi:hypothetical protein
MPVFQLNAAYASIMSTDPGDDHHRNSTKAPILARAPEPMDGLVNQIHTRRQSVLREGSMKSCYAKAVFLLLFALLSGSVAIWASASELPESKDRPGIPSASVLAREMLDTHNAIRAHLNLLPLQWSAELASVSQKWANRLLEKRRLDLNPDSTYGENLFMISGGSASPAAVVRQWASESQNYDYHSNSCSGICGHYTQLVWRRTQRVGCAVARGAGYEIWVCNYDPPGNISGQLPY